MKTLQLNLISIDSTNAIQIRIKKISSDGDELGFHRISIDAEQDTLIALNNVLRDLETQGFSTLSAGDITKILSASALVK